MLYGIIAHVTRHKIKTAKGTTQSRNRTRRQHGIWHETFPVIHNAAGGDKIAPQRQDSSYAPQNNHRKQNLYVTGYWTTVLLIRFP